MRIRPIKPKLQRRGRKPAPLPASVPPVVDDDDDIDPELVLERETEFRTINVTLDAEEVSPTPEDAEPMLLALFKSDAFLEQWKQHGTELFADVQESIVSLYAFSDVLQSIETGLQDSNIDKGAVVLDDKLQKELTALTTFKLILQLARKLFPDEADYHAVRTFLLQPEESQRIVKQLRNRGNDQSDAIRKLYEMQHMTSNNIERILKKGEREAKGDDKAVAMRRSRGQSLRPRSDVNG